MSLIRKEYMADKVEFLREEFTCSVTNPTVYGINIRISIIYNLYHITFNLESKVVVTS